MINGRISVKKIIARVLIIMLCVIYGAGFYGLTAEDADAAGGLTIKAGFYGGPYYDVKTYGTGEMSAMSGGVYIYSGVDSGNFMRLCYAYGVPVSTLINDAGIDVDSVKYLHMGTTDNYAEGYSTFLASSLMGNRSFYPHMVDLIDPNGSTEQVLDYTKVTSDITAGAQSVPTMLAVGCTDFSRQLAYEAGTKGYASYSPSSLDHSGYRLIYGQSGIGSSGAAFNVQTSVKYINVINLQLTGAPNITIEKELISGEDGKIGSKYSVKVKVSLPDSYSYLPDSVRKELEKQILSSLWLRGYDKSVIKVTKKSNGEYIVEIVGEGDTELKWTYSRTEYGGSVINASASTGMSGHGSGSGSGSDGSGSGSGGSGSETGSSGGGSGEGGSSQPSSEETSSPTTPAEPTNPPTQPPTDPPTQPPTDPSDPNAPSAESTSPPTTAPTTAPITQAPTTQAPAATEATEQTYVGIAEDSNKSKAAANTPAAPDVAQLNAQTLAADSEWVAADNIQLSANQPLEAEPDKNLVAVAIGAGILFLSGAGSTVYLFYRRI